MKKLFTILLTLVLVTGCGSKEESKIQEAVDTNETEEINISEVLETTKEIIEEVIEEQSETPQEKVEEVFDNGIDPEFKEAVDSYEKFMIEYVDFMNEFNAATDNTSMMVKYLEYMSQYADTMSKLEGLEQEDLSTEEVIYYNEAMTRILKKLNEIQ